MIDLDAIEARARAASDGARTRWAVASDPRMYGTPIVCLDQGPVWLDNGSDSATANLKHIAAMDPTTTLELCAELRRLRANVGEASPQGHAAVEASCVHRCLDDLGITRTGDGGRTLSLWSRVMALGSPNAVASAIHLLDELRALRALVKAQPDRITTHGYQGGVL